jgi:hypothetical protein
MPYVAGFEMAPKDVEAAAASSRTRIVPYHSSESKMCVILTRAPQTMQTCAPVRKPDLSSSMRRLG